MFDPQEDTQAYERYIEEEFSLAFDCACEKVGNHFRLYTIEIAELIAVGWENDIGSANLLVEEIGLSEKELWVLLGKAEKFKEILEKEAEESFGH